MNKYRNGEEEEEEKNKYEEIWGLYYKKQRDEESAGGWRLLNKYLCTKNIFGSQKKEKWFEGHT